MFHPSISAQPFTQERSFEKITYLDVRLDFIITVIIFHFSFRVYKKAFLGRSDRNAILIKPEQFNIIWLTD